MNITIQSPSLGQVNAVLSDENPKTAKAFYDILPISGTANLWGEEIYFAIPSVIASEEKQSHEFHIQPENPRTVVKKGEIAIWIEQPSFCIFFGKTPMSTDKEIRAYSPVNVIGRVEGNPKIFQKVKVGEKITISKAPDTGVDGNGLVAMLSSGG